MELFLPWLIILLSMLIIKSLYLEPEKSQVWDTSLYNYNDYPFNLPISGNLSLK